MLPENQVFLELAQQEDYICITELALRLEASVSEVRHRLKALGDRVEYNERDQWRIVRQIVVEQNVLSEAERQERDALERTVQQAFFEAGVALRILRDRQLYRETHSSFKSYVRDRFDFTRRAADYLIKAASVMNNLKREQFVLGTNVLPTKESQCRPLAGLPAEQQCQVWRDAVELAQGKTPSAKIVKQAVKRCSLESETNTHQTHNPQVQEVNYTAGMGVEYKIMLDEETYNRLQAYQDKIGAASKAGTIARLLDAVVG